MFLLCILPSHINKFWVHRSAIKDERGTRACCWSEKYVAASSLFSLPQRCPLPSHSNMLVIYMNRPAIEDERGPGRPLWSERSAGASRLFSLLPPTQGAPSLCLAPHWLEGCKTSSPPLLPCQTMTGPTNRRGCTRSIHSPWQTLALLEGSGLSLSLVTVTCQPPRYLCMPTR